MSFEFLLTPNDQKHSEAVGVVGGLLKHTRANKHAKDSISKPEASIAAEDGATKDIVSV